LISFKNAVVAISILTTVIACGPDKANQMGERGNAPRSASTQIIPCSIEDKACQTLADFYKQKPGFKERLNATLGSAQIPIPPWVGEGVSTPVVREQSDGATIVMGKICAQSDCAQAIFVGYKAGDDSLFGLSQFDGNRKWFGLASVAERSLLCSKEVASCETDSGSRKIAAVLKKYRFPEILKRSDFKKCSTFSAAASGRDGHSVCDSQYISTCPYSTTGCEADGEFLDDRPRKLAFNYKAGTVDGDALKKVFDTAYGEAAVEAKQANGVVSMNSLSSHWADGSVEIRMLRLQGVNIAGARYDDLAVMFIDRDVPEMR
jgi:hypothetical protein